MEKVCSRDCESIHVIFCTVAEPSSLLRTCSMKSSQVLSPGSVTKGWSYQSACTVLTEVIRITSCDSIPLVLLYRVMNGEDDLFLSYIYSTGNEIVSLCSSLNSAI